MEIKTTDKLFSELHNGTIDKTKAYKRWVAESDVYRIIQGYLDGLAGKTDLKAFLEQLRKTS